MTTRLVCDVTPREARDGALRITSNCSNHHPESKLIIYWGILKLNRNQIISVLKENKKVHKCYAQMMRRIFWVLKHSILRDCGVKEDYEFCVLAYSESVKKGHMS